MTIDLTAQSVLFPDLADKRVVVKLDEEWSSSDGGGTLLKGVDDALGLTAGLAACLRDPRQPGKVAHGFQELLAQRVFGIALGYPDANDARELAEDPIHKLLLGRDPKDGASLASQPTLSRFENTMQSTDLYRMADALADAVIERHRRRLGKRCKRITTPTATCRSSGRWSSMARRSSTWSAQPCGPAMPRPLWGWWPS